ncbi:MAG: Gldg family protein, partial [Deltaproteobacteria bacterium]|nr:Gldg family protein [Deltaproteobacteria bacterium]
MRRTSALTGLLGLVLLAFGIIGYALTSGSFARLFIFINLIGGAFALIGWLTASWGRLGELAGSRSTRYGANAALYSAAFIGLLIAINFLAKRYPRQFDLTAEKVYSLSPQSLNVVKNLKQPLKLYGFVQEGRNPTAETLFREYAYASPKISYELVDPNRHPELADRFKVTTMNTTHLQYGGGNGEGTNVTDLTEEAITNGILKLTSAGSKQVCFT